jgi:hypothetical protein
LVYFSNQTHENDLYLKESDGGHEEKLLLHAEFDQFANAWSRDAKYILYTRASELWVLVYPELTSKLLSSPEAKPIMVVPDLDAELEKN